MLTASLVSAALIAGLAGAWSPCGLSMVETLAAGSRTVVVLGSLAFTAGALAGGVLTFGGLALAGQALGLGGGVAATVAAGALLLAAAGDATGRRLVPQIRRQVPESWRRLLPVPLASALYGVLLGLGFTTFVLSFATYGIALACAALGEPAVGVAVGVAFAVGRAIPVVVLAPVPYAAAAMAERPAVLRGLRTAAAVPLAAATVALLLGGAPAQAAPIFTFDGADPVATDAAIVWERADGRGMILRDGRSDLLPGTDPAVGPGVVAWLEPGRIVLANLATLAPTGTVEAPGVDAVAVSATAVAWRAAGVDGQDRLYVQSRTDPGAAPRIVAIRSSASAALGRPAIDGDVVAFHLAELTSSGIVVANAVTGASRTVRRSEDVLLLNPTLAGDALLYVRSSARRQQLRIMRPDGLGPERILYSTTPTARRDSGVEGNRSDHYAGYGSGGRPRRAPRPRGGVTRTLWTTALTSNEAFVTFVRAVPGGSATSGIVRFPR